MQDRIPLYPGRVQLIPVDGQENTFDLVRADQATQEGTPLNKGSLLKDTTAAMFDFLADQIPNIVPDDAFSAISGRVLMEATMDESTNLELVIPSELDPLKRYSIEVFPGDNGLAHVDMSFLKYVDGVYSVLPAGKHNLEFSAQIPSTGATFHTYAQATGQNKHYQINLGTGTASSGTIYAVSYLYQFYHKNIIHLWGAGPPYVLLSVFSLRGVDLISVNVSIGGENIIRFKASANTAGVKIRFIEGAIL